MDEEQRKFINDELFIRTVMATFQRSKTYCNDATNRAKANFRSTLQMLLIKLAENYGQPIQENQHIQNIEYLANDLSVRFSSVLEDGRFRIGSAQKALNLYLKYLWCTDQIPMPPHCPFDNVIISRLSGCEGINWTSLDDVSVYKRIVSAAREAANGLPLSQWELREYNSSR